MSHAVLVSIQTGWTGNGKICDSAEGSYSDVETVMTSGTFLTFWWFRLFVTRASFLFFHYPQDVLSFITREIRQLDLFSDIYDIDSNLFKMQNQETTESSLFVHHESTTEEIIHIAQPGVESGAALGLFEYPKNNL